MCQWTGLGRLTSPVIFPLFLRRDRMSSRVDFPAPLGPSSAKHSPGKALPRDGNSTCATAGRSAWLIESCKAEQAWMQAAAHCLRAGRGLPGAVEQKSASMRYLRLQDLMPDAG